MADLIKLFTEVGLSGAIVVVLVYDIFFLQKKLIDIIDKNTIAITELKGIVKALQESVDRHRSGDR